jgi:hypothetical protein
VSPYDVPSTALPLPPDVHRERPSSGSASVGMSQLYAGRNAFWLLKYSRERPGECHLYDSAVLRRQLPRHYTCHRKYTRPNTSVRPPAASRPRSTETTQYSGRKTTASFVGR